MSNKHYVGLSASDIEKGQEFLPFSKVCVIVGEDENGTQLCYFAKLTNDVATACTAAEYDTASGRPLETNIDTFYVPQGQTAQQAGQALAVSILNQIKGYVYKPYSAQGAFIDDDAELGDGVTLGGIYSVLASQDITFDSLMTSSIEAGGADETDNEFGDYEPQSDRAIKRQINTISTRFNIKLGEIESEITSDDGAVATRITQTLNGITFTVTNNQDGTTSMALTSSGISVSTGNIDLQVKAVNVSGQLTADKIATGAITADKIASNSITADKIQAGSISFGDLDYSTQTTISTASANASSANNQLAAWKYSGTTYIDGTQIMTGTVSASSLRGGVISLLDGGGSPAGLIYLRSSGTAIEMTSANGLALSAGSSGAISLETNEYITLAAKTTVAGNLVPRSDGVYSCGGYLDGNLFRWSDVYANNATIQTSDLQKKKDVAYGLEEFDTFFDKMKPCTYKFKDGHGRTHLGLIAQDIEELIDNCGLTTMDVAAFIKSWDEKTEQYDYALRYTEFVPLLIWEVQQLKARVKELEA